MAAKHYTPAATKKIVEYAVQAARAAQAGEQAITLGTGKTKQTLDLRKGGMCARFVRQVHETALGIPAFSWRFAAQDAIGMLENMQADFLMDASPLRPGDILGHTNALHGHIGIYVGEIDGAPTVAENTSSSTRGNPRRAGTKLTPLSQFSYTRIYRLGAAEVESATVTVKIIDVQTGAVLAEYDMHANGNRLTDQQKVYVITGGE